MFLFGSYQLATSLSLQSCSLILAIDWGRVSASPSLQSLSLISLHWSSCSGPSSSVPLSSVLSQRWFHLWRPCRTSMRGFRFSSLVLFRFGLQWGDRARLLLHPNFYNLKLFLSITWWLLPYFWFLYSTSFPDSSWFAFSLSRRPTHHPLNQLVCSILRVWTVEGPQRHASNLADTSYRRLADQPWLWTHLFTPTETTLYLGWHLVVLVG